MKKLICLLTTFLSLFFMMKPVEATGLKWEISKSKTATQLDSNYQTCFPICNSDEFQDKNGNC